MTLAETTELANAAIARYLGCDYREKGVPVWWAKVMETTGMYYPGVISSYDNEFALPPAAGRPMLEFLVSWLNHLDSNPRRYWLGLVGNKGVGKTHLVSIMGVLWMMKNQTLAKRLPWTSWLNQQRSRIGQSVSGRDVSDLPDVTESYNAPLLIVDDLSTGRVGATVWSMDTLFSIMEERTKRRLPTIFVSNAPLADHMKETTRVFSLYRQQLLAQASRANGDKAVFTDLVEKVCDRFGAGKGGQTTYVHVNSITGESYRVL